MKFSSSDNVVEIPIIGIQPLNYFFRVRDVRRCLDEILAVNQQNLHSFFKLVIGVSLCPTKAFELGVADLEQHSDLIPQAGRFKTEVLPGWCFG